MLIFCSFPSYSESKTLTKMIRKKFPVKIFFNEFIPDTFFSLKRSNRYGFKFGFKISLKFEYAINMILK